MREVAGGSYLPTIVAALAISALAFSQLALSEVPLGSGNPSNAFLDVIPQPAHFDLAAGSFRILPGTRISLHGDPQAARVARYFANLLQRTRGIRLAVGAQEAPDGPVIEFAIEPAALDASPEAYVLSISPDRVLLSASDRRGLLYAAVTLWQLCTASGVPADSIELPAMRIEDSPRFRWRGLMLDSARHFQSPEFILRLIDWMALHKLNTLHWHLTDDQAWRLEIKKYPRLTSVGAWRIPAGAGAAGDEDPATARPRQYGGFYSQQTVRRIVAHAADRNVTVVPEIDMPGHATAALVAYPRLASIAPAPTSVPADWGVYPNLYNAERGTFEFLKDVLSEVLQLFPGKYVHIGADEAIKQQWQASQRVQARMRELGLANEAALQGYFVACMGDFLRAHGRSLIGWDEILQGSLPSDATVMSWRGVAGAVAAAAAGHDSILSPAPVLYFDNRQGNLPAEPPGRGRIVTLEDVYRFDPFPDALPARLRGHILGVQANIWTEHIRTEERVENMAWPRAAAVAEIGWSAAATLSWNSFVARLPSQLDRYRSLGIHSSDDVFAVSIEAQLDRARDRVAVRLSKQAPLGEIHYTQDGSLPRATSPRYFQPLDLPTGGLVRAVTFITNRAVGPATGRSLAVTALQRRSSHELESCTDRLLLSLEGGAPLKGRRPVYVIDIMNPCWIYANADLSRIRAVSAAVGQLPFNFQLGAEASSIELCTPHSACGELQVRLDGCSGELLASLSLQPALNNKRVTRLARAALGQHHGVHDLCLRFTRPSLDPLWALDWVQLME